MNFSELGVDEDIVAALHDHGIDEAFPIQEQTIPLALSGQDIIGQAKTGTGKTFGFGVPLLQRLGPDPAPGVQALIVTPTRELASQVYEDLELTAKRRNTEVVPIYGGKAYEGQIEQIRSGAQVVVGTPGRLLDLMHQRVLNLANIRELVLDEADKMLDLGFLPDIEKIIAATPDVRHTMLFSATMPGQILTLARRFMTKPIHIRVTDPDEGITQKNIRHIVYRAHPLDKEEMVARILQANGRGKTIVFMRTKRAAAKLLEELRDRGFEAAAVHGDMNQEQRERSMQQFKHGSKDVLIATDVAARGIDVDDVTHVINHTIPEDEKAYLHRVGRTGRAGHSGIAVTFVDWDDLHKWGLISRALELDAENPPETYSSSPHLYTDLDIPEGTKGRLPGAVARSKEHPSAKGHSSSKEHGGRTRGRGENRRPAAASHAPADGTPAQDADGAAVSESTSSAPRKRRRRRRGSGSGTASGAEGNSQAAPAAE